MVVVECDRVSKKYNPGLFKKRICAVQNLSFQVKEGTIYGLIGPNGAGKSSTIRMLLGLSRPTKGEVRFRGNVLNAVDLRAEIGYLPENPYLYDHLNLNELLAFSGEAARMEPAVYRLRGRELMARLDLLDAQKRPLRTFSKGMLQRAGICFALLHDPSIIVFDEPMSGLDPVGRKMVFDLVMELKQQGKTILFCSHILNDVERLCDRIGLIHKGQMVREFGREDFLQSASDAVFLLTDRLDESSQRALEPLIIQSRPEGEGTLLAVSVDRYLDVNACLQQKGIAVRGCRSEWVSLEDLFVHHIREHAPCAV